MDYEDAPSELVTENLSPLYSAAWQELNERLREEYEENAEKDNRSRIPSRKG